MRREPTTQTILLVLANDLRAVDNAYLRKLDDERRRIADALAVASSHGHCRLVVEPNATHEAVFDRIAEHKDALVGVHFAGHADHDGLHLQDEDGVPVPATMDALADRLARLPALRWIFLNGCGTAQHVEALHSRVPVPVIATERAIRDDVAAQFATRFHRELGLGASLADSFAAATEEGRSKDPTRLWRGGEPHRMLRPAMGRGRQTWPWVLLAPAQAPDSVDWQLVRQSPGPGDATVRVSAIDRYGASISGSGALIAPDRVITAWALVSDGKRPRAEVEVAAPGRAPIAATVERFDAAGGWALLAPHTPIAGHPCTPVAEAPLGVGDRVAVGGANGHVVELDARWGYRRATTVALLGEQGALDGSLLGAPVFAGARVVGVVRDTQPTRGRIPVSRAPDPRQRLPEDDELEFPRAEGPLGDAIQIDRKAQWYELIDLLREERSGVIVFHGEASQAQYHFVARMQRDLAKKIPEPLRVVSVPYSHSSAGAVPASAKEWAWRAANALEQRGEKPTEAMASACEHARLVLVLDAPLSTDPRRQTHDRALVLDFVGQVAPLLLDRVRARHRLHLMVALQYPEADWGFLGELAALARVAHDRPWSFTVLEQTHFPDWRRDVLPFLHTKGVTRQTVLARLERAYDCIAAECRSFERLARAVQSVLDEEEDDDI